MPRAIATAIAAVLATSCGGGPPEQQPTTPGITSVSASESTAGSSTTSASSSSTSAAESTSAGETSTGSAPPDMPEFETVGPPKGCGKIDMLFVIEDSGLLANEQEIAGSLESAQKVRDAANSFIEVMQEQAADYDLQVMVVKGDPDMWANDMGCCEPDLPCDVLAPYPNCNWDIPTTLCDETLGAGVTFPAGFAASNVRCELAGGHRYITAAEPDFAGAFDCIINVGRTGTGQRPAAAMVQAVGPMLSGPDGCNAGFVRPDAMLVVVIITDNPDVKSPGSPEGWAASLVAAKAGNEAGIVVVGIVESYDPFDVIGCYEEPDSRVRQLVEGFPTHVLGSICAPDIGEYLGEAVGVIEAACAEFVPPG